jgi:uncharacterized secreted protein with C-terminal beta-propeller domain
MTGLKRLAATGVAVCLALGTVAGCTDEPGNGYVDGAVAPGAWRLVAYDSCQDAIDSLRAAAKSVVGPYGLFSAGWAASGGGDAPAGAPVPAAPPRPENAMADGRTSDKAAGAAAESAAGPAYSGTNTHEAGIDEPDLVKTDGRRIVTISGGTMRIVDAGRRTFDSFVDLYGPNQEALRYTPANLLLAGNHALVLLEQSYLAYRGGVVIDKATGMTLPAPDATIGPQLILVDLDAPRVLSRLTVDGALVDARQAGTTVRVVVRSSPRLEFPYSQEGTDAERTEINKQIIDQAGLESWLPRIEVTTGGQTTRTEVGCGDVSRPKVYTGTNMLTVLTVNLAGSSLDATAPISVVADGDTVYSNGPSLYVAADRRWRVGGPVVDSFVADPVPGPAAEARTEIYKFDTTGPERPRFVAGGSVPGYLINQYSMSEWDGHLRVATTTEGVVTNPDQMPASESGVHVLAQRGGTLTEVGTVTGLGRGERIYAVRFTGPVGYVVTFRQTDPLYTLDLRNPTAPVVKGELKIPGYSAYLHPAGPDRLIGIGQDATERGRVKGTQVSLFDVADLTEPARLAQYTLSGAHSEAEFDPHAFLYWPADSLLVVPLQTAGIAVPDSGDVRIAGGSMAAGALVLRIGGAGITELAFLQHPQTVRGGWNAQIRRSLVIDRTLWTLSDAGLMANDLGSLARVAWIPFD